MTFRVNVDPDICQGHGLCYFACEELFRIREDDGRAEVILELVPEALRLAANQAVAGCPEQAIAILEAS